MREDEMEGAELDDAEQLGNRVGKYELRSEIGQGRMGTVYMAYDPTLERKVAVKVLAPHLVCEAPFVDGFRRELRSAAQLDHPNIVTVHDAGRKLGRCYFVMNYVEGQPLTQVIRERAPLQPRETLRILWPVAEALDYAHGRGMLHGDIKPANVIVGAEGRVTLTDFAIARAVGGTWLMRWGVVVGTPEYMSPEQAIGQEIGARSDQYALGVLGYEMLTGRVPFQAASNVQLVHQVVYDSPPSLLDARPDLPVGLADVLERVLAKDAAERFASCGEFLSAFEATLGPSAGRATVAVPIPAIRPPAPPIMSEEAEEEVVLTRAVAPAVAEVVRPIPIIQPPPPPPATEMAAPVLTVAPVRAPVVAEPPAPAVPEERPPVAVPAPVEVAPMPPPIREEVRAEVAPIPAPPAPGRAPDWIEEETVLVRAAKAAAEPAVAQVAEPAPAARAPLGIPSVRDEPAKKRRRRRAAPGESGVHIPSVKEDESKRRKMPAWAWVLIGLAALIVIVGVGGYFAYLYGILPPFLEPYARMILPPVVAGSEGYTGAPAADGTVVATPTPMPTPTPTPIPSPTPAADALVPPADGDVGDTWTRPGDAMTMVYVPAGEFQMGSTDGDTDEQPLHAVMLDGFWIDETEVTNTQYRWCVEAGDCPEPTTCDWGAAPFEDLTKTNHPVVCVNWEGAEAYCEWVGGQLPTEAEWEYAARGPAGSVYPWGDLEPSCNLGQYASCEEGTVKVGDLSDGASWCGALDMAGNAWEWVADRYGRTYYGDSPGENPTGPEAEADRVLRGGGWYFDARDMRAAGRYKLPPAQRLDYVGFRCIVVP